MALNNVLTMAGEEKHFTIHRADGYGGIANEVMMTNHTDQCVVKDSKTYDAKYDLVCDPSSSMVSMSMHIEGQDQSIGCIQVARAGGKQFSDIEIGLIQMFCVKVALRLSLEQLQTCSEHLHLQFNSLAEVWSCTSDPHEAIARLVNNLLKLCSASMASFYAVQQDPGGMCEAFLVHSTDSTMPCLIPITESNGALASSVIHQQVVEGSPDTLTQFNEEFDAPDSSWRATHTLAHIVCLPVMGDKEGAVHGVLHIIMEEKEDSDSKFSENDIDAMKTVTNFLAGLTNWAKMEADTERLGGQSSRLSDLVAFLCNPDALDSEGRCCVTLEQIVQQAKEVVSAHVAVLYEKTVLPDGIDGLTQRVFGFSAGASTEEDATDEAVKSKSGLVWMEAAPNTKFAESTARRRSVSAGRAPVPMTAEGILVECATTNKLIDSHFERNVKGKVIDPAGRFNPAFDKPQHSSVSAYDISSMVCAPVVGSSGEVIGVIQLISTQAYHHYDAEDITLIEMLLPCLSTVMEAQASASLAAQGENEEEAADE